EVSGVHHLQGDLRKDEGLGLARLLPHRATSTSRVAPPAYLLAYHVSCGKSVTHDGDHYGFAAIRGCFAQTKRLRSVERSSFGQRRLGTVAACSPANRCRPDSPRCRFLVGLRSREE